ncbi:MAG TPA: MBG domain-containing protein [Acidobacteriaceae bacterium]
MAPTYSCAPRRSVLFHVYLVFALLLAAAVQPRLHAQTTFTGSTDFGTVNVGSSGAAQTLTFTFSSPTSLNTATPVQVLTTGLSGMDFKNAGTGSCGGSTYSTCTVSVTFSPLAPGLRQGAVVLEDTGGNILVTAYIHGAGVGPQVVFDTPASPETTIGTTNTAQGVAVDAASNVYIADNGGGAVYKVTPGGTQTTVVGGLSHPDGIALDGAGNLYVAFGSPSVTTIMKITPAGVQSSLGSGISFGAGMTADAAGNVYVASTGNNTVVKFTPGGTQSTVGTGLSGPDGVAVDTAGNLYIANATGSGYITKIAPDNTQTTPITGLYYPENVTVDPAGNIYVAGYTQVVEYSPTGTQLRVLGADITGPVDAVLDGSGNVYVANGASVIKIDRGDAPTVAFLTSSVGTTSSDSPEAVTVENDGNALLSFPVPGTGSNPTLTNSTDFSIDGSTTCPQLAAGASAAGTLGSGSTCVYALDFKPTTTGTITGSLILADTSLNAASATQTITLNNQGVPKIIKATVTVNTVVANYTGQPIPVTVTTNPAGLSVSIVYMLVGGTTSTTVDPSAPGFYMVTATVTTPGYSGSGTGYLIINSPPPPATPVITWPTPAPIFIGTALSATQLNATANTPGTFTYSPAAGVILAPGTYTLTTTFRPTDTTDFVPVTTATVTLIVQPNASSSPVNFGQVNVGVTSTTQTVTFNFLQAATLNSTTPVQVLTQGTANLDFHNTAAGNCAGSYSGGGSCTVTVNFTPAQAGLRSGAVVLQDASGKTVATASLYGIGLGPEVAFDPGTQTTVGTALIAEGAAADSAGNLYVNTGIALVKVAPDGTQTPISGNFATDGSYSSEGGTGVDGAGNVYVADTFNNRVMEYTPGGASYTVGTGFNIPYGVAVDGAGDIYVADTKNSQVVKVDTTGTQTVFATGFVYPEAVTTDAAGNVYVVDNATSSGVGQTPAGIVYKYTPGGVKSIVVGSLLSPSGAAVDAAGNVFVTDESTGVLIKVNPSGVQTTVASGLKNPFGVALDGKGNLYVSHVGTADGLTKIDRSTAPTLTFASTTVGSTSSDSPQTVTLENVGTSDLHLAAGQTTISANFALDHPTCPVPTTTAGVLASGATCTYPIDFKPTASDPLTGSLNIGDDALNVAAATQTISLSGTGTSAVTAASVMLGNLSQTYTGSPLPITVTTVPAGLAVSVTYNGSATVPTAAGSYAVVATITDPSYSGSASGTLVIAQAVPTVTWAAPASITYGTALSATQLNATASAPGTFVYTPAVGVVPAAGTDTLSATFTPSDAVDYTTATKTVSLIVSQATPTVTWATPTAITYGTALSGMQLNATASVPGTFVYSPAAGTVPGAGSNKLNVTFTPTDGTDYTTATASVFLTVNQATPTVTWVTPAPITSGTALSSTQLNATASVPGTFVYSPAAGTVLGVGSNQLNVTFTPTDGTDYTAATASVFLTVNSAATPTITWATPAPITYGTALSGAQLNATASVPGTFVYSPAAGTVLSAGSNKLNVTFTPTDTTNYTTATASVFLTVNQATPSITWATPGAITYGTALSSTQLNATASVPGTFVYSPAAGTVPSVGSNKLNVTFTPTDSVNYTTATASVFLTVNQATPTITWATPAAIVYGTALSGAQLNATASVPGTFAYSPAAGTVPAIGSDKLSVTFTPTDSTDYTTATASVFLTVNQATPTITWATPAAIVYGTALSGTQLNATASVPGTFAYSPAAGAVLQAGTQTLAVTFTPTDATDYATARATVSLTVTPVVLTVSASNASRVYGAANPAFTGSISGNVNNDAFTESFSTTATTASPVGTYAIVPSATGADLADYTVNTVNGTLTVTQAGSTTLLQTSSTSIAAGQTLTLTAQVASGTSGTPTGNVQFFDGATLLTTATLTNGVASASTSALTLGSHALTAVYGGDTNFTGSNSGAAINVTVTGTLDFTISALTPTNTVLPGAAASYSFTVTPVNGTYPASVNFSATGLPPGATATFSPTSIAANGGMQTVTVSIQTPAVRAANQLKSTAPLLLALLLLPLPAWRRVRRCRKQLVRLTLLFVLVSAGIAGMTGCASGNGYLGQGLTSYTVTLTATSGAVQHSATVTLNVE